MESDGNGGIPMRNSIISAVIILIVVTQYALGASMWTKEPTSVRGIPFGASVAEAKKKLNNHTCETNKAARETRCYERHYKTGRAVVDGSMYLFKNDKLVSVLMEFKSSDYDYLKEIFIQKYGDPIETVPMEERKKIKDLYFNNGRLVWIGDNITMGLSIGVDNNEKGSIYYTLNSYIRESSRERKKEEEKEKIKALNDI